MRKEVIITSILFILFFCSLSIVYADGCHISDEEIHLYLPNQKAIVSWDGVTEKMVLSSSVATDEISNIVWIVPIQSYSKPEVEAGNISLFEDLVDYFKVQDYGRNYGKRAGNSEGGVEVIESKEVDIYDITILKTESASDLLNWLNNNEYNVPEEAEPIFEEYVQKNNMYFVANKIDLKNKYSEELELLPEAIENAKGKVNEERNKIFLEFEEKFEFLGCDIKQDDQNPKSYQELIKECLIYNVKKRLDSENINYTYYDGSKSIPYIQHSVENYPKWGFPEQNFNGQFYSVGYYQDYVIPSNYKIIFDLPGINTCKSQIYDYNDDYVEIYRSNTNKSDGYDDPKLHKCVSEATADKMYAYANIFKNEMNRIYWYLVYKNSEDFRAYDDAQELIRKDLAWKEILKSLDSENVEFICGRSLQNYRVPLPTRKPQINLYQLERAEIDYENLLLYQEENFTSLCKPFRELKFGMATPLKFIFQPEKPYYPLEISSLGEGVSNIEVYVISENPMSDQSKVMQQVITKKIDSELKGKLTRYLENENAKYIMRFSWRGNLNNLTKDSIFIKDNKFKSSFWQEFIDWFKSLFS